jgi:hypothetical protein
MLEAAPLPADPGAYYQDDNSGYQNYSPEQLDNLLSPIALYPDPLLAQVMVAATFPDQIEEAARWVRGNGTNGIDDQYWDVSVKSVAHYPTVVEMMADKIDWTTAVGQAYVNQSTDVSASIQHLRHMARGVGNLESTPQQEVVTNGDYIGIYPYQPQYIYVPVYDPAICYYRRPYWGPAISFGAGFVVGAWLNLGWHWGGPGIYYTGWGHSGGWYGGWVDRCRPSVHVTNVYVNNRYTNVTINRTVINRTVNVTNINNYNYIHKNVTYNNVQVNNTRINNTRINNRVTAGGNGHFSNGSNGRPNNDMRPVINNPGVNNKIIDRNIDRNNPRIDQYRGRDNNFRNDRPPASQERPLPAQQQRPVPQNDSRPAFNRPQQPQERPQQQYQQQARPAPHTFNRSENNFDPRVSSQRGQASRQQTYEARPAQQSRPAPQPRADNHPAPQQHGGGGERRKP